MSCLRSPKRVQLAAAVALLALASACASDPSAVEPLDRLLANERSAYAARTRDFDATLRFAAQVPDLLEAACGREATARVRALENRIRLAGLARLAHFESLVWSLQWESPARQPDETRDALRLRLATADAAAETAREEALRRPNDARLAAAAANAEAERARLRSDLLLAEREVAHALAVRVARLRQITRARVDEAFDALADELRQAGTASCRAQPVFDPMGAEARRAAYSALHSAQVEGLTTLRVRRDRLGDRQPSAGFARDLLADGSWLMLVAIPLDPGFQATLDRLERDIQLAERDLTAWIDAGVGELRNGSTPGM